MTADKAASSSSRRLKILYVATEDWYFISDTLPLAKAALAQGYDVHVAARSNGKEGPILDAGLTFHPLQKISRSRIGALTETASVAELTRLYRRVAPDLVHHIALKTILYGAIAARTVPRLASVNAIMGLGFVFTSESRKARALRPFMAAALRLALAAKRSRTIVQNADDLEAVASLSPRARAKLRLLRGSGVDCEKFTPQPEPKGAPVVVLLEAAACTRAVVTTDAPGCRECVQPGVNGWLVPVRDAVALTNALREALSDAAFRQTYATAGRRLVEQHFAAPIIIAQTLALYDELLRR